MECVIGHQSEQIESGKPRRIDCEVQAIGVGEPARWLQAANPGTTLRVSGFLAARSQNSRQLRLHINSIEFVEGNQNG